jgi:hypothetical protein
VAPGRIVKAQIHAIFSRQVDHRCSRVQYSATGFHCAVAVMRNRDALEILSAKLAAVEQEHQTELETNADLRDSIDAKAEARALTAVLDFLQNCKVVPSESLLRLFRRYLHAPRDQASSRQHQPKSRAS